MNTVQNTPLWDESLTLEERLDYLVKQLTLEEKIQCLSVKSPDIERLGIKSFSIGAEAAHGVEARHDQEFNKGIAIKTTVFTQPFGMSATWDTDLIEKAGIVTGTEARAIYKQEGNIGLSRWAPTVDLERDPRWGRTEEGYGEDPYLTGKMSSAYIRGIQGRDDFYLRCGATLKHFYANNTEKDRTKSSSSLDSRNKHEYYLEPFHRAITEGKADSVMTSYNEINGIPSIVNQEVQKLLKDEWGLRGHVVCDMGDFAQNVTDHHYFKTDTETLAYGLKAGIDSFNDPEEVVFASAREALKKGFITEDDLNRSIRNTFSTKIRLGFYDKGNRNPYSNIDKNCINTQEHKDICLEVAKKAMVLLKNEEHMLPLEKNTTESIAVIGPCADEWYKDWYSGLPLSKVTPFEGLQKEFSSAELTLVDGNDRIKIQVGDKFVAVKSDGICYLSDGKDAEVFEHTDWGDNKHTLRAISNHKFLTTDMDSGCIIANQEEVFSWFVQESFSFHGYDNETESKARNFIIECWNHQFISVNEEGTLIIEDKKGDAVFSYKFVIEGMKQAVEIAKSMDKIIAVMGCHPIISGKEDADRVDLFLPPVQRKILQKIKLVNPNIILVLITNYPYAIDWEKENLPAILTTASGSQDLGTAIAKAIAGEYSPAGRLNMTWYQSSEQLPPIWDYDIIQGKRTYQYFDETVLYPFGYGQSYTEFLYRDIELVQDTTQIKIKLNVKNVGSYDSDEVVQLYVSQLKSRTVRPIKQLKGFERVWMKVGEEKKIEFILPLQDLYYYDVVSGNMVLEDSEYEIQVGASSQDIRLKLKVHINGTMILTRDMTKTIPCDHYDSYQNIYLHRGHDGKPCILPKVSDNGENKVGTAIYNDVSFPFVPKKFWIDMKAEEQGTVTVRLDKLELAMVNVNPMDDFKKMEIPIDAAGIEVGENKVLQIDIQGKVRVVEFSFQ
jgi:Beta-glucosidase-related glycosidases